ncbi:MAG: hypothetical protein PF636_00790 [Actinomycetota bacterium]|nr:hypothetical protein [Actinomycetota bacterium]
MPAYDFKCQACSTVFEVIRPLGKTENVVCPECAGATKRVFSPVGVVFKGSGFHNTDYRPKPPVESDSPAKSPDSTEGSTKKEPTPCSGTGSTACDSCPAAE